MTGTRHLNILFTCLANFLIFSTKSNNEIAAASVVKKPQLSYDIFNAEKLKTKLWAGNGQPYDPSLIPISNNKQLNITVEMLLSELVKFDSVNQALELNVWLRMQWYDARLVWNPEEYGGIKSIRVKPGEVWKPDVTLYNSADRIHQLGPGNLNNQVYAIIYHDGTVTWVPITLYKSSCPMKLRYFPFDVQMCVLTLASWVHNTDSLYFHLLKNKVDTEVFTKNNVWYLEDTVAVTQFENYGLDEYQEMKFYFIMSRNYSQYLINVVLTCSLLVSLCFLSFWITGGDGAGHRLSLCLSVMVALSVYLLLAADLVPLGTDKMPLLVEFLTVLVILMNFSVVITMIDLVIAHANQVERPPRWLFTFLVEYFGKLIKLESYYEFRNYSRAKKAFEKQQQKKEQMRNSSIGNPGSDRNSLARRNSFQLAIKQTIEEEKDHQKVKDYDLTAEEKLADVEWDLISLSLDRFCMIIYAITFITMLIYLFVNMDSYNRQIEKHHEEIMKQDKYNILDCDYRKAKGTLEDGYYKQYFCDYREGYKRD